MSDPCFPDYPTPWQQAIRVDELERENAALRKELNCQKVCASDLAEKVRELREDKARLDWLAVSETWFDEPATESFTPETFRAAIDSARKEAQP